MNELTEPKEGTGKNEILKGISNFMKKEKKAEKKKKSLKLDKLCNLVTYLLSLFFIALVIIYCVEEDISGAIIALAGFITSILLFLTGTLLLHIEKSIRKSEKRIRKLQKEATP